MGTSRPHWDKTPIVHWAGYIDNVIRVSDSVNGQSFAGMPHRSRQPANQREANSKVKCLIISDKTKPKRSIPAQTLPGWSRSDLTLPHPITARPSPLTPTPTPPSDDVPTCLRLTPITAGDCADLC